MHRVSVTLLLLAALGSGLTPAAPAPLAHAQTCTNVGYAVIAYNASGTVPQWEGAGGTIRTVNTDVVDGVVRSVWAFKDFGDKIEMGWLEGNFGGGASTPSVFLFWRKNGVPSLHIYTNAEFNPNPAGDYHQYRLVNTGLDGSGRYDWEGKFDGDFVGHVPNANLDFGYAWGNSERKNTCDSAWGHFTTLQKLVCYGCLWSNWTNLQRWCDTDPTYGIHKISNTEFYSEGGYGSNGGDCATGT